LSPPGSVTHWLNELKAGNPTAAQQLWERYFQALIELARKKLQDAPRRAADEEDVALSAFDSFCRGVAQQRFPQLSDRNDLWKLLVVITARKAIDLIEHETRQKRGGGVPGVAAGFDPDESTGTRATIEQIVGREPTPAFAAQVAEEYRRLLHLLDDDELRAVAVWKMEGYTTAEIAGKLGCVERSVERRLRVIRSIWAQEIEP
jgi:DNA-directed RNA polymerase specialized sigma24 family protein